VISSYTQTDNILKSILLPLVANKIVPEIIIYKYIYRVYNAKKYNSLTSFSLIKVYNLENGLKFKYYSSSAIQNLY